MICISALPRCSLCRVTHRPAGRSSGRPPLQHFNNRAQRNICGDLHWRFGTGCGLICGKNVAAPPPEAPVPTVVGPSALPRARRGQVLGAPPGSACPAPPRCLAKASRSPCSHAACVASFCRVGGVRWWGGARRGQAGPGGQGPGRGRRPERTPASPPLVALPAEKPSPLRGPRPLTRMGTRTPGPWDVTAREQARRGFTSHALPGRGRFGSDGATRMLAEAAFRVAGRTECCAIMCRFEDSEKCQAGASRNGPARLTVHERGSNLGLGWPDRGP